MNERAKDLAEALQILHQRVLEIGGAVDAMRAYIEGHPAEVPSKGDFPLPSNPFPIPMPLPKLVGGKCLMLTPPDGVGPIDFKGVTTELAESFRQCREMIGIIGDWGRDPLVPGSGPGGPN